MTCPTITEAAKERDLLGKGSLPKNKQIKNGLISIHCFFSNKNGNAILILYGKHFMGAPILLGVSGACSSCCTFSDEEYNASC